MGVETAVLLGGGAAAAGALKGYKGTPAQTTTQQAIAAPAGAQEQELQSKSLENYMQANQLASQLEQNVGGAQTFQDQARAAGQNILSGQAMKLTPEEQAAIATQRQALIDAGSFDINAQQNKNIAQAQMSGANRGLRGQAFGALQGQVYQASQEATGRLGMQANQLAAQAAQNIPMARIQAQSGMISQGMSLADQLRQQAVANRSSLQNPALMASLQNERLYTAQKQSTTPASGGGVLDAIAGGLAAGSQGLSMGTNIMGGANSLRGAADSMSKHAITPA
jgi:hypothetical protein